MAANRRIASTQQSGLRPLGVQGQLATHAYSQLTRLIATRLSARHAAILAEPVADAGASRIDWYTAADGAVEPVSALPEAERAEVMETLRALGAEIAELARSYAGQADPDRQQIGKLLALALQFPAEQDVYRVGDQPVVVRWGHAPEDSAVPPHDLTRARAFAPSPRRPAASGAADAGDAAVLGAGAAGPAGEAARVAAGVLPRGRWEWLRFLAWLLLGLLIMLAILALWRHWWPDRLMIAPWRWHVAAGADDALGAERAREDALRIELGRLRAQLADRRAACPNPAATPPAPTQPPAAPPDQTGTPAQPPGKADSGTPAPDQAGNADFDERLAREHAKDGELQISLLWNNVNDLDLAVIEPDGRKINYRNRTSPSGGVFDVDMNAQRVSAEPVESIYWPAGHAVAGRYQVFVRYFQANPGPQSGAPTHFAVRVKMGDHVEEAEDTLPLGAPPKRVIQFDVAPRGGPDAARPPVRK